MTVSVYQTRINCFMLDGLLRAKENRWIVTRQVVTKKKETEVPEYRICRRKLFNSSSLCTKDRLHQQEQKRMLFGCKNTPSLTIEHSTNQQLEKHSIGVVLHQQANKASKISSNSIR
uniref:Uncharacterized protein n=1 Tax=Ditylenchus dipsaci TaxID=166011 RepID=A0A915D305_9BILA